MILTRVQLRGKVSVSYWEQGICPDGKDMQGLWPYCRGGERSFYLPAVRSGLRKNRSCLREAAGSEVAGGTRSPESGEARGEGCCKSAGGFPFCGHWQGSGAASGAVFCAVTVLAPGGLNFQNHAGLTDRYVCSDAVVPGRCVRRCHNVRHGCRFHGRRVVVQASGVGNG